MQPTFLSHEEQDAVLLAVHEAVVNGIEHGTRGSPVLVAARFEDGDLIAEITTVGAWVAEQEADATVDDWGRGLALMRGLTDGLEIVVDDECVTVRLRTPAQAP